MNSRPILAATLVTLACVLARSAAARPVAAALPDSAGPVTSTPAVVPAALPGPPPWLPHPDLDRPSRSEVEAIVAEARSHLSGAAQSDPLAVIDQCVLDDMAATDTPGASIAIAVDGVITHTRGYGVKHKENGGEIGPDTLFRIGSTTKMMTAAALMTLVDSGEVDLDEPITTYLPELVLAAPWNAAAITPRHLLTHSAGLPDSYLAFDEAAMDRQTLELWAYEVLPYTGLNNPPGAFWNYSNPNFSLAGLVVQEQSGQLVMDYTEDAVWEPAGMPLTTFRSEDVVAHGDFAYGHYGSDRLTPDRWSMRALAPAGTAFSTPTELVTWALVLMEDGGGILSPESAAAMQARQISQGYYEGADYGFGVFVTDYRDLDDPSGTVTVYDHGGNVPGWSSQLFWVPERGLALSILANTMTSLGGAAACVLRELGAVVPADPGDQTTDPSTWAPYEGVYAMQNQVLWDFTYRVERRDDRLIIDNLDLGGTMPLMQVLRDTFLIDADGDQQPDAETAMLDFTFVRDPADAERVPWLRNRLQVGQRVGRFPGSVELEGTACRSVDFVPEIDMERLAVRASGLVQPSAEVFTEQPILQSNAQDPSSATYKREMELRPETGLFLAVVVPQPGDNLELYLLRDENEDTQFTYPDELAGIGLPGGGNIRAMLLPGRPPAGRYQLWVHGTHVGGPNHTFTLQRQVVDGDQLTVAQSPTSARAGEPASATLCARGVGGLSNDMAGLLEFDYGRPPRRVRIPVSWSPAVGARIFLPTAHAR